jgi:hypothetical protein
MEEQQTHRASLPPIEIFVIVITSPSILMSGLHFFGSWVSPEWVYCTFLYSAEGRHLTIETLLERDHTSPGNRAPPACGIYVRPPKRGTNAIQ